jgi:hypothetical protein
MLDLGNLLDKVASDHPELAVVIQKIADFTNNLARNSANSGNGNFPTPPNLEGLSVKASGGLVHISITHNAPIQKGITYFTEADTNPAFPQPHVIDHGSSRSHFVNLPAKNDSGAGQSWYFRSYAQYPGSKATSPINFGGTTPTAVSVGGNTSLTPLSSTGSGTASANGQQGGQGLGTFLLSAPSVPQTASTLAAVSSAITPAPPVIQQVATPTFSEATGTYTSAQTVSLACSTVGSSIYYTIDGSIPSTGSTMYTVPISVATTETITALAVAAGLVASIIAYSVYTINIPPPVVATPMFIPAAGTYTTVQSVAISCSTVGSTIYYTLDGSTPSTSTTLYVGAISVGITETINAIAVAPSMTNSVIASSPYIINLPIVVATPTFSVAAGTYTVAQSVFINCTTASSSIYYTLDGSTPTTGSTLYTGVISVGTTETVKALAVAAGDTNSAIASALYTINLPPPVTTATPTFSPFAGTYTSTQTVSIACSTASSTIYYTVDGSTPTTGSTVYTTPISVIATDTIKALATASGDANSAVGSSLYTISPFVATPTFSVASGTYTTTQSVSISSSTSGSSIYYTTDGSTPTTGSTLYSGPVSVATTETLKAIATKAAMTNSAIASNAYIISPVVFTPTFSPIAGTYAGSQSVSISCSTVGATIYYTTNGTTPTTGSTVYSSPISVTSTKTLNAIAAKAGMTNSLVGSSIYTITLPSVSLASSLGVPSFQDMFNYTAITGAFTTNWAPQPFGPGTYSDTSTYTSNPAANVSFPINSLTGVPCLCIKMTSTAANNGNGGEILSQASLHASTGLGGYGTYEWQARWGSTSSDPAVTGTAVSGGVSSVFLLSQSNSGTAGYVEIDAPECEGQHSTWAEYDTWYNSDLSGNTEPTGGDFVTPAGWSQGAEDTYLVVPTLVSAFHYYGLIWSPGRIDYYLDGILQGSNLSNIPAPGTGGDIPGIDINHYSTNSTSWGGNATVGTTRYMYVQSVKYWV